MVFFLCRKTLSRDAIVFIRGDSRWVVDVRDFFFFLIENKQLKCVKLAFV